MRRGDLLLARKMEIRLGGYLGFGLMVEERGGMLHAIELYWISRSVGVVNLRVSELEWGIKALHSYVNPASADTSNTFTSEVQKTLYTFVASFRSTSRVQHKPSSLGTSIDAIFVFDIIPT